jgi:dipeptidyl aminopeptidase/acylaminoacyl peptidase
MTLNKIALLAFCSLQAVGVMAQKNLDITGLWQLGRVSPIGLSADNKSLYYQVAVPNIAENKSAVQQFQMPIGGGLATAYKAPSAAFADYENAKISADGKHLLFTKEVAMDKIIGSDKYSDLPKSNAYIFTSLNNRHWDTWEDGSYSHVFIADIINGKVSNPKDIMMGEKYDCPQKPMGGAEDVLWSPDNKTVLYVCKKKFGTAYAISTNTDIYAYDIIANTTTNLTEGMMGYDVAPAFSKSGRSLAWLSMARDGFESDKQEIIVMDWGTHTTNNITKTWDETVSSFAWSNDETKLYFEAPYKGTVQLWEALLTKPVLTKRTSIAERRAAPQQAIRKITDGQWDVTGVVAETDKKVLVTRTDMNHATEIYSVDKINGTMAQLTHVNDAAYNKINMCKIEGRTSMATDGKNLFSWIVYPPNFDATKKYPVLLYCQGGPQGSISQFYSFRWNFQLMASAGYIVVVPNRRGCQGWGTKWNEDISKDWGGQAIQDYLSAFDNLATEPYVDKNRCGAVGASYGGYSVFMLAGIHQNRFKSFIAHDGLFDLRSWYGTTEELWFANFDIGGPYWGAATRSYEEFNPSNLVKNWNTPIMIVQGGKDYRVGIEQGLQAFQAAQLKGIKSKLLYLPEENHWVLKAQNAQVWQREFYSWLEETLK